VYRLITKGTYENEMFNKSSLKLGLDHAVLKTYTSNTKDGPPVLNKEEIENMLKRVR
jgi:SNF2 family DNA or RNA helicase